MKKLIGSKLYDSETAEVIAEHSNGYNLQDANWERETIYKTKNGSWFNFVRGGGLSAHAKYEGGYSMNGEDIVALTEADACTKLKEWNEIDAVEKFWENEIEEA